MSIKALVPWWAKVGAKLVLSRLPARYHFWQSVSLFVHGDMHHPEYALRVVRSHVERAGLSGLNGRTVLELGPGDSLATAIIAKALGAARTILVDTAAYATDEIDRYQALTHYLKLAGLSPPDLSVCTNLDEILVRCDACYLTAGVASLRAVPSGSVDFVFSQAVLEHVRKALVRDLLHETLRCLSPTGIASHTVDLQDHLGGALNNLRFSEKLWEADWVAGSGFYTNRLRFNELDRMFRDVGFDVQITRQERFAGVPTPRSALNPPFRAMSDDDLLVSSFDVLLTRSSGPFRTGKIEHDR